jgi:transposase
MATGRRQFTAEFKLEAVRLVESGRPVSAVARELQIGPSMLRRWRRQYASGRRTAARGAARSAGGAAVRGSDVFPGNGKLTSQDEEIRQLRREVGQLREERDILKKATALQRPRSPGEVPVH